MATLLDLADRLSHNISCVKQAAHDVVQRRDPTKTSGPFTEALLSDRPLTVYLRDAYPGESRLLAIDTSQDRDTNLLNTVAGGSAAVAHDVPAGRTTPSEGVLPDVTAVTRRQIVSATPLRRRNVVGPAGEGGDVFLHSAL
ncbi:hypothetical protein FRB99_001425, partial [Tulasnella sp. 403]